MAITAVEHAQVAPRGPSIGCVVDDRYIVAVAYNDSTSGSTPNDFAVFDAVTKTSAAYTIPLRNTMGASIVAHNGYAWFIGKDYTSGGFKIARINPATGGYTLFTVSGARTPNVAYLYYLNGFFFCGTMSAYDAPYGVFDHYRFNATTLISAGYSGASFPGSRFAPTMSGTGNTMWLIAYNSSGTALQRKIVASTGVISDNSGSSFPGGGVVDGSSLYSGTTAWDMATETTIRTLPAGIGSRCLGPDGLLYSVDAASVQAVNPITGATRVESFPVNRAERTRVYSAAGKLWTPSGYPL